MTKLVVTDIDSTLVPDGSITINPEYFTIIEELHKKGIIFAVCSGRHAASIKKVFEPVLDKIWIASQNGNVMEHDGKIEVFHAFPNEWAQELWEDLSKEKDAECILDTAVRSYCPYEGSKMYHILTDEYHYDLHATGGWSAFPDDTYSLITIYHPEAITLLNKPFLKEKWSKRITITKSGNIWIICSMPDVSKGAALLSLCRQLKIDPKESIAFGDGYNDIPMIRAAGIGYAVKSDRKEVMDAADFVIPGYESHGVLRELKKLV